MDAAARRRPQIAHAGREGVEVVQRFAESTQRQRLHVEFHVGARLPGVGLGERPQLGRRHAHRPAAFQQILQADARLSQPRRGNPVQRLHAVDLDDDPQLQVVLQVLAHPGQGMAQRDAAFTQPGGFSDARQLQQMRRVHRPRRHYHFARRAHGEALAAAPQLHAHAALAFEHQLLGLRARHHMQPRRWFTSK
ncbi:hypothetical protein G6F68_013826 [Rhizopus microsporus]|nr:hypothetical protein G6F68_013826 [Rhizopus microsporus]